MAIIKSLRKLGEFESLKELECNLTKLKETLVLMHIELISLLKKFE